VTSLRRGFALPGTRARDYSPMESSSDSALTPLESPGGVGRLVGRVAMLNPRRSEVRMLERFNVLMAAMICALVGCGHARNGQGPPRTFVAGTIGDTPPARRSPCGSCTRRWSLLGTASATVRSMVVLLNSGRTRRSALVGLSSTTVRRWSSTWRTDLRASTCTVWVTGSR
jgi:hypothetical protein